MRCKELRERVDELWVGEFSPEVREHLVACPACKLYLRSAQLMRAGFQVLAEEPTPDPSVGFAARVVRALREVPVLGVPEEFLERIGRRFVYATLFLTLVVLLALILPASGPVRGPTTAALLMAQPEVASVRFDPLGSDLQDSRDLPPAGSVSGDRKGKE
jgi:predicted anti-sigma-YlaC factor YlaD